MSDSIKAPVAVVPREPFVQLMRWGFMHPKFAGLRKSTGSPDFSDPFTLAREKIELNSSDYLLFRLDDPDNPDVRIHGHVVGERRSDYRPTELMELYLGRDASIDDGTEELPFVERFRLDEIINNAGALSLSYGVRLTQHHDRFVYKAPDPTRFLSLIDTVCAVEDFDWSDAEAKVAELRDDTRS